MFDAFLTTALEVIILLDILGAIIYFVVSGIVRAQKQSSMRPAISVPGVTPCPAGASVYPAFPPEVSYVSPPHLDATASRSGWPRLRALRDRFGGRSGPASSRAEGVGIEAEQRKIRMILNSFKEDV